MENEAPGRVRGRASRSPFFLYLSMSFLAIAIIGFSTTLFLPLARGTFRAPPVIHIHGALLFGWRAVSVGRHR